MCSKGPPMNLHQILHPDYVEGFVLFWRAFHRFRDEPFSFSLSRGLNMELNSLICIGIESIWVPFVWFYRNYKLQFIVNITCIYTLVSFLNTNFGTVHRTGMRVEWDFDILSTIDGCRFSVLYLAHTRMIHQNQPCVSSLEELLGSCKTASRKSW